MALSAPTSFFRENGPTPSVGVELEAVLAQVSQTVAEAHQAVTDAVQAANDATAAANSASGSASSGAAAIAQAADAAQQSISTGTQTALQSIQNQAALSSALPKTGGTLTGTLVGPRFAIATDGYFAQLGTYTVLSFDTTSFFRFDRESRRYNLTLDGVQKASVRPEETLLYGPVRVVSTQTHSDAVVTRAELAALTARVAALETAA